MGLDLQGSSVESERQGWVVPSGGVADGVAGDGWCWGVEQGFVAGVEGRAALTTRPGPVAMVSMTLPDTFVLDAGTLVESPRWVTFRPPE